MRSIEEARHAMDCAAIAPRTKETAASAAALNTAFSTKRVVVLGAIEDETMLTLHQTIAQELRRNRKE